MAGGFVRRYAEIRRGGLKYGIIRRIASAAASCAARREGPFALRAARRREFRRQGRQDRLPRFAAGGRNGGRSFALSNMTNRTGAGLFAAAGAGSRRRQPGSGGAGGCARQNKGWQALQAAAV